MRAVSRLALLLVACGGATPLESDDDVGTDVGSDSDGCDSGRWPCRLAGPQCGCHDEERCALDAEGERICEASMGAAGVSEGEPCGEARVDDCVDGAVCTATTELARVCRRWCEDDLDCTGEGGACEIPFEVDGKPVPDARLCTIDCNPRFGTGCADDAACQLALAEDGSRFVTDCSEPLGAGVQGDACDDAEGPHCARGFGCDEGLCRHYCEDPGGMAAGCSDYQACAAMDPPAAIGGVEYGVCR